MGEKIGEKSEALDEAVEFIRRNRDDYNDALRDKKIIDNYVSGNGFSPEALRAFESFAGGSVRARAKVNAKFISGYVNQLKGLLIANKFDLSGGAPKPGLVNALNNSALSALSECLNYGEGFLYIDGETVKPVPRQSIITARCDNDDLSDCGEAVIISAKQMGRDYRRSPSLIARELDAGYESIFAGDERTALKIFHYKVKEGRLTVRTFMDDSLEREDVYESDWLPVSRAVCEKVLDGSKIANRGLYIGIRDLLDQLSLDYSVIRSKVGNNPDAFAVADKRALADKAVSSAWDAPFGRSVLPFIGSVSSAAEGLGDDKPLPAPSPLVVPFNIEALHQDIAVVKQDIQNILGFNYAYEEQKGNETAEAALLRRDNSYNSKIAYIEPVAQAVIQIVKVYNRLLNTGYEVVNKVFVKIERDEKLRKVLAIIQNPQKGYESLLAEFAGFSGEEAARIAEASGAAKTIAEAEQAKAAAERLAAENERLGLELMNYRLDTSKVVESNKIRANVEIARMQAGAQVEMAKIAQKNEEIARKYEIEIAKLLQKAKEEAESAAVPVIQPGGSHGRA